MIDRLVEHGCRRDRKAQRPAGGLEPGLDRGPDPAKVGSRGELARRRQDDPEAASVADRHDVAAAGGGAECPLDHGQGLRNGIRLMGVAGR